MKTHILHNQHLLTQHQLNRFNNFLMHKEPGTRTIIFTTPSHIVYSHDGDHPHTAYCLDINDNTEEALSNVMPIPKAIDKAIQLTLASQPQETTHAQ